MKWKALFLIGMLIPGLGRAEEALIMEGYSPDRYQALWKKSPFTLSSITEEVQGGFAQNLALAGILKIGKRQYVSVYDKETKKRLFLSSEAEEEGILVEKIEFANDLDKVTVTLKKGAEISTLRYDQEFLKQPLTENAVVSPMPPPMAVPFQPSANQPPTANRVRPPRRIIVPNQVPPK
jgi:hypothetical protein